jgi:hypothetical protein
MDRIKAPALVVDELFQDFSPLGTQTAKIGDSANGVVIAADKANPDLRYSVKIGGLAKVQSELDNYRILSRIIGDKHTLPGGSLKIAEDHRTGEQYGALVVPYIPDLQPFSRQNLYVPKYGHTRERRMGEFATLSGKAMSEGFMHGDFQAKNVGNRANGVPMVFDLEASSIVDPSNEKRFVELANADLLSMYKSLAIKSLFGLNPEPLISELESSVLSPWLDAIEDLGSVSVDMAIIIADKSLARFREWLENGGLERAKSRFVAREAILRAA